MIDTHCHLQFNAYKDDRNEVINRCQEKGLIVNCVGTQKDTSKAAVELAEKHDWIYASIGLHPIHLFPTHVDESEGSFISREEDFDEAYYEQLVKSKKVVAIGEAGLDLYHLPKGKPKEEVLSKQKEVFTKQYFFAQKYHLPLVIHVRDAHEEMIELLNLLKHSQANVSGVVHCYTSNWHYAQQYLDMGLYLGFTGVITFPPKKTNPKAQYDLLDVVDKCPIDRILTETDAPYLAPQAYRGKKCEPWMVEEVTKTIANIKNRPLADITNITYKNAAKLFKLKI